MNNFERGITKRLKAS